MGYNPEWNNADMANLNSQGEKFVKDELNAVDLATQNFASSFAGLTRDAGNALVSDQGEKLTGSFANELYGLSGTSVAFDDNEKVTDNRARIVSQNLMKDQMFESNMLAFKEQDVLGSDLARSIVSGVSGLAGGILDPVALGAVVASTAALGAVTTAAVGSLAARGIAVGLPSAVESFLASQSLKAIIAQQAGENFIGSLALEPIAVGLKKQVANRSTTLNESITTIIGGTIIGAAIGTGFKLRAGERAQVKNLANDITEAHGDHSTKVIRQTLENQAKDIANGKKPSQIMLEAHETDLHTPRYEQRPYKFTEINTKADTLTRSFYVSKTDGQGKLFSQADYGEGTIHLTDKRVVAENAVSSLDGNTKGRVFELRINKDARIITDAEFPSIKKDFSSRIQDNFFKKDSILTDAQKFDVKKELGTLINKTLDESASLQQAEKSLRKQLAGFKSKAHPERTLAETDISNILVKATKAIDETRPFADIKVELTKQMENNFFPTDTKLTPKQWNGVRKRFGKQISSILEGVKDLDSAKKALRKELPSFSQTSSLSNALEEDVSKMLRQSIKELGVDGYVVKDTTTSLKSNLESNGIVLLDDSMKIKKTKPNYRKVELDGIEQRIHRADNGIIHAADGEALHYNKKLLTGLTSKEAKVDLSKLSDVNKKALSAKLNEPFVKEAERLKDPKSDLTYSERVQAALKKAVDEEKKTDFTVEKKSPELIAKLAEEKASAPTNDLKGKIDARAQAKAASDKLKAKGKPLTLDEQMVQYLKTDIATAEEKARFLFDFCTRRI